MRAVWEESDVLCIHPGALPQSGYEAVIRSWEQIFAGADMPTVQIRRLHRIEGDDLAVHLVEERIAPRSSPAEGAVVLATNIYRRGEHGWQLIWHQGNVLHHATSRRPTLQ